MKYHRRLVLGAQIGACLILSMSQHMHAQEVGQGAAVSRPAREMQPPCSDKSAEQLLSESAKRYPSEPGAAAVFNGPLYLEFVRELRSGQKLSMSHTLYYWPPDRSRLELHSIEGNARDSISLVTPESAWLLVDGQRVEVNRNELLNKISSYTPQSLLRTQLEYPQLVAGHFGGQTPTYVGCEEEPGKGWVHVIRLDSAEVRARVSEVRLVEQTLEVRSVTFSNPGGVIEYLYSDYRKSVQGWVLPHRIELKRGESIEDTVEIQWLEVLTRAPDALLRPEEVRPPVRRGRPQNR